MKKYIISILFILALLILTGFSHHYSTNDNLEIRTFQREDFHITDKSNNLIERNYIKPSTPILVKLKDEKKNNENILFRLQVKKNNEEWVKIGGYNSSFPEHIFKEDGVYHLHIDIINKENENEYKGIWLGRYIVANELKSITKYIQKEHINLFSTTKNKLIERDNISLGEEVNVIIDSEYASELEYAIFVKKAESGWKEYKSFDMQNNDYKFDSDETVDIQIKIRNKENEIDTKSIWLGQFKIDTTYDSLIELPETLQSELLHDNNNVMMKQFIVLNVLNIYGLVLLLNIRNKLPIKYICLLSFLISTSLWAILSIVYFNLNIVYNLNSMILGLIIILLIVRVYFKNFKITIKELQGIIGYIILFLPISLLASYFNFSIISHDSLWYVIFAQQLVKYNGFHPNLLRQISSYGLFMPTLHSLGNFIDIDMFYSIHKMLDVCFIAIFGFLLNDDIKTNNSSNKYRILIVILGTSIMATSYFWIFNSLWILNNHITGILFTMTILLIRKYSLRCENIWLYLSLIFLIGFGFSRVESPFISIFLLFIFTTLDISNKSLQKLIFPFIALMILWYLRFFLLGGTDIEGDFLTIKRLLPIILGFISLMIYVTAIRKKVLIKIQDKLSNIMIVTLMIAIIGLFVYKFEFMVNNINVLLTNMFFTGSWGLTWYIIIALNILSYMVKTKEDKYFNSIIFIYFQLVIIIFAFRVYPLRLGFGDSANRMLLHIYPVIMYYLFYRIGCFVNNINQVSEHNKRK